MTPQEQTQLVEDLLKHLREKLMEASPRWPSHWNGIELRELVADTARDYFCVSGVRHTALMRAYHNDRIINNL